MWCRHRERRAKSRAGASARETLLLLLPLMLLPLMLMLPLMLPPLMLPAAKATSGK